MRDKYESIEEAGGVLQHYCHQASYDAGWWHTFDGKSTKDNPLTFSNKLMLIVSEIAEAMEADRKKLMDDKLPDRDGREVELADAIIRICDLAGAYNMDLGGAIAAKMKYNTEREDHKKEARQSGNGKSY